jgi:hypothetical protein
MGKSVPQCLGHLDLRKSVVGLATGAGAIYLLYKAIKAGLKCKPPLCTASPICIARECLLPGEGALPQEAPAPEASCVGRPKGDSFKFLSPSSPFSPCSSGLPTAPQGQALLGKLVWGFWVIALTWEPPPTVLLWWVSKSYMDSGSQHCFLETCRKHFLCPSLAWGLGTLRKGKVEDLYPEIPLVHMIQNRGLLL